MSSVSDLQFSQLPLNDTLYRLVGAAKILPKKDEMETPRVQLWFAEIDNRVPERLAYARRASGACSLLSVIEAAGSLPTFPLGSFWHDKTMQHGLIMGDQIKIENLRIPPQSWILVPPKDYIRTHGNYGMQEFPLGGEDIAGQLHDFRDAPYYRCYSDTGLELIIPAYEVFRRFYGVCSFLANALLSNHWSKELRNLIVESETGFTPEGDAFRILTKHKLSSLSCRAIAHFETSEYASMQAQGIFLGIQNSRRAGIPHPWIQAHPHWTADKEKDDMTLSFLGQQLSSGAILVMWIYNSEFPPPPVPLVRVLANQKIPINSQQSSQAFSGPEGQPKGLNGDPVVIHPPADTRLGNYVSHLSINEMWSDLPDMRIEYKKITFTDQALKSDEKSNKRKKNHGTGHKSSSGSLSSASLSAHAQSGIKNRFSALAACFMQLEKERVIKQRLDYGLINPVAVGSAVYCMLPTQLGPTDIPWAIVGRGDDARGRLCWVSEIELPDGSLQYFFELEVLDEEAFYALIVKPIENDARLAEETLVEILKLAVSTKGRWNNGDWRNLENSIIRGLIKHKFENGVLSADYVRRKLL